MSDAQWLANLQPGDEVACGERIERVERLTATQIICGRSRYNRKTGRRVGEHGGYGYSWIAPVTPALRDRIARREALNALRHTDTTGVPTETLKAMVALLADALIAVRAEATAKKAELEAQSQPT